MTIKLKFIPVLLASAISIGCANKQALSQDQAMQAFPNFAQLNQQVAQATQNNVAILSPKAFGEAKDALEQAQKLALSNDEDTSKVAAQGQASLDIAKQNSEQAREIFSDVLNQRQKTLAALGESSDHNKAFRNTEDAFLKLTKKFERKEYDDAKAGRVAVIQSYADIELNAVKANLLSDVKKQLFYAKEANLDDLAPKTFRLAQEEIDLAVNTLDLDRTNTQKANAHVQKSLWYLNRAKQFETLIKQFETDKFTEEDKLLWYQSQLDQIAAPLNKKELYDQSNKVVIDSLVSAANDRNAKISLLDKELRETNKKLTLTKSDLKKETENLKKEAEQLRNQSLAQKRESEEQLEALRLAQETEQKRQQAIANKFSDVQKMFEDYEADVYRKGDDVLIRAHGFNFKSGLSEIDAANFALLNKIVSAIGMFENSSIVVSGHTDAVGSDDINLSLSQQRADKVALFLSEVGGISPLRIDYQGYGESRPIATNETDEGRTKNRRVEFLIKNSASSN